MIPFKGKLQQDGQRHGGDCWARSLPRVWSGQQSGVHRPPWGEYPAELGQHASEAVAIGVGNGLAAGWRDTQAQAYLFTCWRRFQGVSSHWAQPGESGECGLKTRGGYVPPTTGIGRVARGERAWAILQFL